MTIVITTQVPMPDWMHIEDFLSHCYNDGETISVDRAMLDEDPEDNDFYIFKVLSYEEVP